MSCEILRDVVTNGKAETLNGSVPTAIKWAADHGAVICQNSWAYSYDMNGDGKLNSSELAKALAGKVNTSDRVAIDYFIKYAGCDNNGNQLPDSPMKGGLVVFAAGNENIKNGVPANYEPVVAVAAIEAAVRRHGIQTMVISSTSPLQGLRSTAHFRAVSTAVFPEHLWRVLTSLAWRPCWSPVWVVRISPVTN